MFEFVKKILNKFLASEDYEEYYEEEEEKQVLSRDSINIHDKNDREEYIRSCIDQITDAQDAIDDLNREYAMVTGYLTDMEEIEALSPIQKKELVDVAEKIVAFENEKQYREDAATRMADEDYYKMQRMEKEAEEGIKRLTEVEDLQNRIHQDMRRLSGELHAFRYHRHDLKILIGNLRGMLVITAFAFVTCMAILFILKSMLNMDIRAGYILTAAATVASVFFIFFKYNESVKEKARVEKGINRIILLQNRVKIRYVNNTNLLEYLYLKYDVESCRELYTMWNNYLVDRDERLKIQELYADLAYYHKELLRLLRALPIKYPQIWLKQADAIGKKGEMVEIRHNLIIRRQKLRNQVDHNEQLARRAQTEIKSLMEEFPQYSAQIVEMVSQGKLRRDRQKGVSKEEEIA